jgi:hypothetical protein
MKKVAVPATTREALDYATCDVCGHRLDERLDPSQVDDVVVSRTTGYNWGNDANLDKLSLDLCGECFQTKLVPWLEAQGAEFHFERHRLVGEMI